MLSLTKVNNLKNDKNKKIVTNIVFFRKMLFLIFNDFKNIFKNVNR